MSLTSFQSVVLRVLATLRVGSDDHYIAGGAALNELIGGTRFSHDVDLFNDSNAALIVARDQDVAALKAAGFEVTLKRAESFFVEADISRGGETTVLQWAVDSAFRFFPLQRDATFGAVLHPFDLATNKALALVGRHAVRDWVDTIACARRVQPLGLLFWAACGKDPGYNVQLLHNFASRVHFSRAEFAELRFKGPAPDIVALSQEWHRMLDGVLPMTDLLPPEQIGTCVCGPDGRPFNGDLAALKSAAVAGALVYRPGHIRGVWPEIVG